VKHSKWSMVSGQWKQLAQIVRPADFGALLLIDH
jgi:hypothetical protein